MDIFTADKRSQVMSRVRGKDTAPEMTVRRYLHGRGLRFRLHGKGLPGKPDIVFASRRVVLFVHGCFWHGHVGCRRATLPATRREFWEHKIRSTVHRDVKIRQTLEDAGWTVLIIWQCELSSQKLVSLGDLIAATPTSRMAV